MAFFYPKLRTLLYTIIRVACFFENMYTNNHHRGVENICVFSSEIIPVERLHGRSNLIRIIPAEEV